jgi:hypothetical protein
MASVISIENQDFTCTCGQSYHVDLKRSKNGASYFKDATRLNLQHLRIIAVIVSGEFSNLWFTKKQILNYFNNICEIKKLEKINEGPFFARTSELVAVGILDKSEEVREDYLKTIEGPYYRFNYANYSKFLQDAEK